MVRKTTEQKGGERQPRNKYRLQGEITLPLNASARHTRVCTLVIFVFSPWDLFSSLAFSPN